MGRNYFIRCECRILESLDPNPKFYGLVRGLPESRHQADDLQDLRRVTMATTEVGPWLPRKGHETKGLRLEDELHTGKLAWNTKLEVWKMIFLFIWLFLGFMLISRGVS